MKKILSLVLVFVMLVCVFAGCGKAETPNTPATPGANSNNDTPAPEPVKDEGQTWTLNLGTSAVDPTGVNSFNGSARALAYFAEKASEYTDGRVDITVHWGSVLGTNVTMFEEVEMGTLDFHQGQPMSSADARFACWSLPYTFDDYDEIWKGTNRQDGEIFALADKWMAEHDVKLLAMGVGNVRGFVSNVEVRTPADAKNLKIRTYEDELVNMYWGSIGTPSIIGMADMYSALETKTVDALEMFPSGVLTFKFYELAKYFAPINWQWTCGAVITCPMELWNSFPADIQDAIQKAADEYAEKQYEWISADDAEAFEALRAKGMTVTDLTDEELEAWRESGRVMTEQFKEYIGAEVYEEYMAAVEQVKGK